MSTQSVMNADASLPVVAAPAGPPPPVAGTGFDGDPGAAGRAGPLGSVVLRNVSKAYGLGPDAVAALDDISLEVGRREFVCVVGGSGCGKSTLLHLVGGLDRPTRGEVVLPAGDAALMFQDAALFPWLTAAGNVELAVRLAGGGRLADRAARRRRVGELLEAVHMGDFADRRPHQLSGGMRQRVALARALAQDRPVLLMDEPFGALDAITRDLLQDEVERVWQETPVSVVFVTHNVREAVRLGDRVVVLSSRPGRVVAEFAVDIGRPRRIESPAVAALATVITDRLREEVRRHGGDRRG
ncbi:MAG: ABC transporter ATP-binding protein [Acidimicrobiales bacterium]